MMRGPGLTVLHRHAVSSACRWLGPTLVAHWIEGKVKVLIDCPRTWDLVGVMPLGVPAERPEMQCRPLGEMVCEAGFGRPWDSAREFPFRPRVSPTPEI